MLDAFDVCNLMRFANYSDQRYQNCEVKVNFSRGANELCLYSKRPIAQGEELVFDYGFKVAANYEWLNQYNKKYIL